jgi:hypothetical protein
MVVVVKAFRRCSGVLDVGVLGREDLPASLFQAGSKEQRSCYRFKLYTPRWDTRCDLEVVVVGSCRKSSVLKMRRELFR